MPTSRKEWDAMKQLLPNQVDGPILELGSGWGTLAFRLAKKFPNNEIIAYELSPIPWLFSVIKQKLFRVSNIRFFRRNFIQDPLPNSSLIVCYLFPDGMKQLASKIKEEFPRGTLIVSNTFALPGFKPTQTVDIENLYHSKAYLYQR